MVLIIKRKAVPAADPKDGYADPLVTDAVKEVAREVALRLVSSCFTPKETAQ